MRSRTANWFLCKIRYEKVTEQYVVDALSFTEAEARIMEQMSQYISGEFEVVEIDRCVFKEVFFMDWANKVLENDTEKFEKAIRKKSREDVEKWDKESLEDKFSNTDTQYYKAKLHFITIDEKTDKEKKTVVNYLVEGCSLESARKNIDEVIGGTMIDYRIAAVSETNIIDVFEYVAKEDSRPESEK